MSDGDALISTLFTKYKSAQSVARFSQSAEALAAEARALCTKLEGDVKARAQGVCGRFHRQPIATVCTARTAAPLSCS